HAYAFPVSRTLLFHVRTRRRSTELLTRDEARNTFANITVAKLGRDPWLISSVSRVTIASRW
ncbi:MAG: hypothetical protein KGL62_17135, partial [Bradyrhizobium sp.]|uniref:hypothetical protein n=1 Tax=Bradyrhizobium sp. TaxID=376 RepID=UPI002382A83A